MERVVRPFAKIMVHVDLGRHVAERVNLAARLAKGFGADLVGVAAEEPLTFSDGQEIGVVSDAIVHQELTRVGTDLAEAKRRYRSAVGDLAVATWREATRSTSRFLLEQARSADLVIVGREGSNDASDWRLGISPGDIVLGLGRPMLVIPPGTNELVASRVIVAWKDTREARRALHDAIPFLCGADEVLVVSLGRDPIRPAAMTLWTISAGAEPAVHTRSTLSSMRASPPTCWRSPPPRTST